MIIIETTEKYILLNYRSEMMALFLFTVDRTLTLSTVEEFHMLKQFKDVLLRRIMFEERFSEIKSTSQNVTEYIYSSSIRCIFKLCKIALLSRFTVATPHLTAFLEQEAGN